MFLETERLILRKFTEDDFAGYCAFVMDPERNRMMGNRDLPDEAAARELFDWLMENERRFYAIVYKESGKVIGELTVCALPPPVAELPALQGKTGAAFSFSIARDYRRQGLMFEAVRTTIQRLLYEEGMDFVNAGYFDFNEASGALQKKLGFTHLLTHSFSLEEGGEQFTTIDNIIWRE